jgi:hypothetical protein
LLRAFLSSENKRIPLLNTLAARAMVANKGNIPPPTAEAFGHATSTTHADLVRGEASNAYCRKNDSLRQQNITPFRFGAEGERRIFLLPWSNFLFPD